METSTGSTQQTTDSTGTTIQPTASATTTSSAACASTSLTSATTTIVCSTASPGISSSTSAGSSCGTPATLPTVTAAALAAIASAQQQQQQQQHHTASQSLLQIVPHHGKQDDSQNISLASGMSEGQRSLSAAPSASSSPILSPQAKIYGRNANGTLVATSRPSNEAEVQLYRVLQKASLLAYYDTLLEMGGDDVQQLYEAGEEEFLEIMALVGMASKPLHVRRLQKALHEWALSPQQFQAPIASTSGQFETPAKSNIIPHSFNIEPSVSHSSVVRTKFPSFNPTPIFNPTPLISTAPSPATSAHLLTQICSTLATPSMVPQPAAVSHLLTPLTPLSSHERAKSSTTTSSSIEHTVLTHPGMKAGILPTNPAHQVTSSSPQLTPVLSELQVARITIGAEKIASQLPQREPRAHTSKKRASRELEQVMNMSEKDPRRMDEIRKYSAIYGRFDCKRRPEKPLTLHEVCVNEAAAQLCRLVPALLTRRDELFPLARQIVKDAGFGHSATIARYGNLLSQIVSSQTAAAAAAAAAATGGVGIPSGTLGLTHPSTIVLDCESSESNPNTTPSKKARLSPSEASGGPKIEGQRDLLEDSRYNLFAMYQKFAAKPSFDLTDIAKFASLQNTTTIYEEQDPDTKFSFSNSSSSPSSMPNNSQGEEEEEEEEEAFMELNRSFLKTYNSRNGNSTDHQHSNSPISSTSAGFNHHNSEHYPITSENEESKSRTCLPLSGDVKIVSASGSHIIAVANPALVLSPTINEAIAGITNKSSNLEFS